ncbi:MAG: hypothetical protein ACOYMN_11445, partial [Roseimicrobium sp.]
AGPPGKAFRLRGKPFILHKLPDYENESEAYIAELEKTALDRKTIEGFSRKPRTFACCAFPVPTKDHDFDPKGVVCIDSPDPCEGLTQLDLEHFVLGVMAEIGEELAMTWSLRT